MRNAVVLSVIDQGLVSAFTFLLNIAFIAYATPAEFGHFVLVIAASFFVIAAQNALIVMPLNYLLPGRPQNEADAQLSMLTSANLALGAVVLIAAVGLSLLVAADAVLSFAIVAFFAMTTLREYVRNILIVTGQVHKALIYDAAAIAVSAGLAMILWSVIGAAPGVLVGMVLGNLVALVVCVRIDLRFDPRHFFAHLCAYKTVWRTTGWALQGAMQGEIAGRSYVFLVEHMRDAASLGTLNAGRVVLSPLLLISTAWSRIARPRFVVSLRHERVRDIRSLLTSGVLIMAGLLVAYAAFIVLAWPIVEAFVFRGRYPGIETVVSYWWIYAFAVCMGVVPATLMEARRQFRELAIIGLVAAALIPAMIYVLLAANFSIASVVLALALAHVLELFVLVFFMMRKPALACIDDAMAVPGE